MYRVARRCKPVLIMEDLVDLEYRIRRAMSRLEDVREAPGFEDVDVDRLRAVLEQILAQVRQMSVN
jgi:hypothetical protein